MKQSKQPHSSTAPRKPRGPYKGRTTYARATTGKRWTDEFQQQLIIKNITEVASGCWLWNRAKNNVGYGMLSFRDKWQLAHRHSYTVFNGPIPDGLNVLHYCDNPGCVAPHHLYAGTQERNQQDMVIRGRSHARYGKRPKPVPRTDRRRPDNVNRYTDTFWCTDGVSSTRIKKGEQIPQGFHRGMMRKVVA